MISDSSWLISACSNNKQNRHSRVELASAVKTLTTAIASTGKQLSQVSFVLTSIFNPSEGSSNLRTAVAYT